MERLLWIRGHLSILAGDIDKLEDAWLAKDASDAASIEQLTRTAACRHARLSFNHTITFLGPANGCTQRQVSADLNGGDNRGDDPE